MSVEALYNIGRSVEVHCNERQLVRYNHAPLEWGHPNFHPVRTPAGHCITTYAPADHPWHCGIWFSWKSINAVNVWEDPSFPDGKSEILPIALKDVGLDDNVTRFSAKYRWQKKDAAGLLEGSVSAAIHPPVDQQYWIDLDYSFQGCGGDTSFERIPYHPVDCDWGGYAGLSYRPVRDFSRPRVTNSEGESEEIRGKPTRWLDLTDLLDGYREAWAGVCLMDHPANLRHPVPANFHKPDWCHLRWSQLALLFEDNYTLPAGESLDLRYRVVVHDGKADVAGLNRIWDEWTLGP